LLINHIIIKDISVVTSVICFNITAIITSPVRYVFSFRIFGDLKNYTFLETLGYTESEKQCLHFFQAPYGRHLGFSKWRLFFSEIRQYLSF